LCCTPAASFAVRGVIGFEHFGQVGAAATNISRRLTARRIFLVELPMQISRFDLGVEPFCQPRSCGAVTGFRFRPDPPF
jgi:hypothetical protein